MSAASRVTARPIVIALVLLAFFGNGAAVHAQAPSDDVIPGDVAQVRPAARTLQMAIRQSIPSLTTARPARAAVRREQSQLGISRAPGGSTRKALIAIGVVAGMFAGASLGAAIDGNDGDSGGLKGAVIGFGAGAVGGGLVMAYFTR
jgi:hypothetical protein